MIVFFKLARFFNELRCQFLKCRLHVGLPRLFGELHALFGLMPVLLRSGHAEAHCVTPLC
jgi:hypothetical protein